MTIVNRTMRANLTCLVVALAIIARCCSTSAQQGKTFGTPMFPAACYLLGPNGFDYSKDNSVVEHNYTASSVRIYHLWCEPSSASGPEKDKAADEMAVAWKAILDRETPFNAAFHEESAFELLVLIGVTRRLPIPLRNDSKFLKDWITDCANSCFEFYVDPDNPRNNNGSLLFLGWLKT